MIIQWDAFTPWHALAGGVLLPTCRDVEPRLVLGSAVFGIGSGLAGICPGPAIVSIGAGPPAAGWSTAAKLTGIGLFALLEQIRRQSVRASSESAAT